MKAEIVQLPLNTCKTSSSPSSPLSPAQESPAKMTIDGRAIVRKEPPSPPQPRQHSNHSNVVINLDKNKINLRRPRSRLLLRPLSLPSSFRALRLFHSNDSTATSSSSATKEHAKSTKSADEKIDIAFIKALEDEIYRTKAEVLAADRAQQLKHRDSCFCCGNREDSPASTQASTLRKRVISNDYSYEYGVQLRNVSNNNHNKEMNNRNRITSPDEKSIFVVDKPISFVAAHPFNKPRPQSQICTRRSAIFKWPFLRHHPPRMANRRRMQISIPSTKPKFRSHSWPVLHTNPISGVNVIQPLLAVRTTRPSRSKFISKSCDNLVIALPMTDTIAPPTTMNAGKATLPAAAVVRRWRWLNLIYLWRRRNSSIRRKPYDSNNNINSRNDGCHDDDDNDCMQNNRISIINKNAMDGGAVGCNLLHRHQSPNRRGSSFRMKRHSSAAVAATTATTATASSNAALAGSRSTTSTTDVVKAWVYRRRFLLHKYSFYLFFFLLVFLLVSFSKKKTQKLERECLIVLHSQNAAYTLDTTYYNTEE